MSLNENTFRVLEKFLRLSQSIKKIEIYFTVGYLFAVLNSNGVEVQRDTFNLTIKRSTTSVTT